ncbi:MAG: hypothetical protein U0414_15120 [Polyangiaceae bacterium]
MMKRLSVWGGMLLVAVSAAAVTASCDDSVTTSGSGTTGTGAGGAGGNHAVSSSTGFSTSSQSTGATMQGFDVQPAPLQTITVGFNQQTPTVVYTATLNGTPVNAAWGVDRGNIGTVPATPASTATFTPTGTTGGLVNVLAGANAQSVKRQVFVKIVGEQNGADPTNPATLSQIATDLNSLKTGGGLGGVGGEGLGPAVSDAPTLTALGAPTSDGTAEQLKLLYPYDKTVWPRGLLAPLLQWSSTLGGVDAIQIELATTSGSFSWKGTFAKPPILTQTGGPFVRHPIPEDVWKAATDTAGAAAPDGTIDQLIVKLTVAKGGAAYGPITETWNVAPARLSGTVYYNSYGTQLVKNSTDNDYNGQQYGAAVLSIRGGETGPTVVAGPSSGYNGNGCRVCHVVASDGSKLIVQDGNLYSRTSTYDLKNGNAETTPTGADGTFGWAGLSPDGKLAFTNTADLAASGPASQLYAFPPTGGPLAVTGIPANLQAGTPTFSPDGKHVAFDFLGGTIGATTGNGTQLVAMDFDGATNTFSNLKVLATMTGGHRAGFPSFFPTNDAVAYHHQIVPSNHRYNTWHNATAQVWWSDLATGTNAPLKALNGLDANGVSTLPTGPNHADDTVLNYEPTVNPVASGGYVWVVFTSRRLYGNVATTQPWLSDPRSYDTKQLANVTTKKLWVSAVDLNAPAGSDPSHPSFYLPAQELLAGNARAFWVLDPCKNDGESCESGDQCCNGFCEPDQTNALVCSNMNPNSNCSMPQEKCTTAADCCDTTNLCVNGFCSQLTPPSLVP